MDPRLDADTLLAGAYLDADRAHRPLSPPIFQASTYQVRSTADHARLFAERSTEVYLRFGNPTSALAGARIAALEGAEAGLVFSSGMAAISTSLLAHLEPGSRVLVQDQVFAQTSQFFSSVAPRFGITVRFVDFVGSDWRAHVGPGLSLVYLESPSNPYLKIADIGEVAAAAHSVGARLFIDSTFASPYLQQPLSFGADLVLHSATKFLSGHSDVQAGAAVGSIDMIAKIYEMQVLLGGVLDPHAAWLLMRGMRTLGVRLTRQSASAARIAAALEAHPAVSRVYYPGLPSHPSHRIASKQMRTGGAMISFQLAGGREAAKAMLDGLEHIPIATSLGGVETVIELPYDLDFNEHEVVEPSAVVDASLIRLSVGLEDPEFLLDDLLTRIG